MPIVVAILALALFILVALLGCLVASLLIGGLLSATRARVFAPIFLAVVPSTVAGALLGGIVLVLIALRTDDTLIVLGPIAGLVAGGLAGFFVGLALALFSWRRTRVNQPDGARAEP